MDDRWMSVDEIATYLGVSDVLDRVSIHPAIRLEELLPGGCRDHRGGEDARPS
jgi:hypothetical protein